MGEARLQLPAAHRGPPRRRSGLESGRFLEGIPESARSIAHHEAYSLFRKRRPEGETEELQPETLEGAATLGGNAVFPVELTLAVSTVLRKLTGGHYRAALAAAPDDEPVTEGDAHAIERTAAEIQAGKVVEHPEILREFGIE